MNAKIRKAILLATCISLWVFIFRMFSGPLAGSGGGIREKVKRETSCLKLGWFAAHPQNISLNAPVELDYTTRETVLRLRKEYVMQHPDLVRGNYSPAIDLFGQIEDIKPWWGIEGQICLGTGLQSSEGLSEESRFIVNPFLLLAIDESFTFRGLDPCPVVYPKPAKIVWDARKRMAIARYDMSDYSKKRPLKLAPIFELVNLNARDFGYNFVYATPNPSRAIEPKLGSRLFYEPVFMRSFIHAGGSCAQPGGCNNVSPYEPDMIFRIKELPAVLTCKLWKQKPRSVDSPADFIYIIKFK